MEVYKGDKYDDTAITEIYFDGLDVLCLAKGTLITMGDRSQKAIENIKSGDKILSYNIENEIFEVSEVQEIAKAFHDNLFEIKLSDQTAIICTTDHPFLSVDKNWVSLNPEKTQQDYQFENLKKLKIGTELLTQKGSLKVVEINQKTNSENPLFTIVKLQRNKTFIANGIITGTEELRPN